MSILRPVMRTFSGVRQADPVRKTATGVERVYFEINDSKFTVFSTVVLEAARAVYAGALRLLPKVQVVEGGRMTVVSYASIPSAGVIRATSERLLSGVLAFSLRSVMRGIISREGEKSVLGSLAVSFADVRSGVVSRFDAPIVSGALVSSPVALVAGYLYSGSSVPSDITDLTAVVFDPGFTSVPGDVTDLTATLVKEDTTETPYLWKGDSTKASLAAMLDFNYVDGGNSSYGFVETASNIPDGTGKDFRSIIPANAAGKGYRAWNEAARVKPSLFPRDTVAVEYYIQFSQIGGMKATDCKVGFGLAGAPAGITDPNRISYGGTKLSDSWSARTTMVPANYLGGTHPWAMAYYLYAHYAGGQSYVDYGLRKLYRDAAGNPFIPTEGVWYKHRIEFVKNTPGERNGVYRCYIDGVKYVDLTDVMWNPTGYDIPFGYFISQTFGNQNISVEAHIDQSLEPELLPLAPVSANKLPWAPPAGYENFKVVRITNSGVTGALETTSGNTRTITLGAGGDYRVYIDEALTKRVVLDQARHVVIIGGERVQATDYANGSTDPVLYNQHGGIEPRNLTGVLHLEGLLIHGEYMTDALRSGSLVHCKVQIQNCRFVTSRLFGGLHQKRSDGTIDTNYYYHTDAVQFWNGVTEVRIARTTLINPYQCLMIGDGDLSEGVWGYTEYDQVDISCPKDVTQYNKLINIVTDGDFPNNNQGPYVFKGLYYQPGEGVAWNNSSGGTMPTTGAFYSGFKIPGPDTAEVDLSKYPALISATDGEGGPAVVRRGKPPHGENCPPGVAGVTYVSPGYGASTPTASVPTIQYRTYDDEVVSVGHPDTPTKVRLKIGSDEALTLNVQYTSIVAASSVRVSKHTLPTLSYGTHFYRVEVDGVLDQHADIGRIVRIDPASNSLSWCFSSCHDGSSDATVMKRMADWGDPVTLHLGDKDYFDNTSTTRDHFRTKMRGRLSLENYHRNYARAELFETPSDHDAGKDDGAYGSDPTGWQNWNDAWRDLHPGGDVPTGRGVYRYRDRGPVRFIIWDTRSFKSNPSDPDTASKHALGDTQEAWTKQVLESMPSNMVAVILSDTPWHGGPDATDDSWEGYTVARKRIGDMMKLTGKHIVFNVGDAHSLAYDLGANNEWGFAQFLGSPINKGSSHKPDKASWGGGVYPTSTGVTVQQYARMVVTRTTTQIKVEFRGYRASDNVQVLPSSGAATKTFAI